MCEYLERELNVDSITVRKFGDIIRKDFDPTHTLPLTKKSTPPPTAHPLAAQFNLSPSPSYGQRYPSPPKTVHPKISRYPPSNYPSDNKPSSSSSLITSVVSASTQPTQNRGPHASRFAQ